MLGLTSMAARAGWPWTAPKSQKHKKHQGFQAFWVISSPSELAPSGQDAELSRADSPKTLECFFPAQKKNPVHMGSALVSNCNTGDALFGIRLQHWEVALLCSIPTQGNPTSVVEY